MRLLERLENRFKQDLFILLTLKFSNHKQNFITFKDTIDLFNIYLSFFIIEVKQKMKVTFVLLMLLSVLLVNIRAQTETNQIQDDTDSMLQLSKIIISTIEKYDHTEKGVIPYEKYHLFLHQIFIKGHQLNKNTEQDSQVPQYISGLLKLAAQDFRKFRYEDSVAKESQNKQKNEQKKPQKRQFVELQQFYMDLIKHFSEFLDLDQNKQKYQSVNAFFFTEQATKNQSQSEDSQKISYQEEKLQL